jgi:ABC-type antimicrobial peptide transport system permease subunit
MDQLLDRDLRPWRMGAILFSALGVLALIVASIGIYGLVAYAMNQRTHEVGVRIALGARTTDVLSLVVREGVRLVLIGVAAGIFAALLLKRFVASMLYGVAPADPSVYGIAGVTMCLLALIASALPGWRAARIDPVSALRSE